MYFKLTRFSGIAPGVAPRLLSDQFAQTAENIDFQSGVLTPIKGNATWDTGTLTAATRRSLYSYEPDGSQYWLQWDEEVDVVRGPVPNDAYDRIYWTGEDYPRVGTGTSMIAGSTYPAASYRLGIPAPTATAGTSKSGTADETQTPYDVSYVYTYVSAIGEEGPPSPASAVIELTDSESVTLTMEATPTGNYNFGAGAKRRIYRSNTGSTNTQFQFVGEVAISSTSFTDTLDGDELGEILPSETWIGPPDDNTSLYPDGPMEGLINVANGIMAGFSGNRLCLSEPYLPHAWPIAYRITIEDDIVAIASTGNGIIVLTDGAPYFVTGVDPSAMTAIRMDLAQACVNKNSVVNMGEFILYAAPDGLVAVSGNQAQLVTEGLISSKQWNDDFSPTTIRAFRHENTYVAFRDGTTVGWVYDPRAQEAAVSTLDYSTEVRGAFSDPKDGELYTIEGTVINKYRRGSTNSTLTWKSKKFITTQPLSMGWVHVEAETYPVTIKVWADGVLIAEYAISQSGGVYTQTTTTPSGIPSVTLAEPLMRLPSKLAKEWEVEVSGSVVINEFCLAQTIDEIKAT